VKGRLCRPGLGASPERLAVIAAKVATGMYGRRDEDCPLAAAIRRGDDDDRLMNEMFDVMGDVAAAHPEMVEDEVWQVKS
jgi:hypothetical protein